MSTSTYIDQPRVVCALGALESVLAIDRAVPVLHAGPGCSSKLSSAIGGLNGCQGSGYIGSHLIPCTNLGEKEVVFGGNERLADVIENSLKVIDGDLYIVLSGCTPEIVGDDVAEVVKRFADAEKPVIFAETAGFKGNNLKGHELVVNAIIEQYLKPAETKNSKQVNIWATVPFYDPFWVGNFKEIELLVRELGLEPNIVFGPKRGLTALNKVPAAAFNLLLSPWVGLENVKLLEEKFGTPYLHIPVLPIGPTATSAFLRTLSQYAGIDSQLTEEVINRHEDEYYYFIERAADELLETRLLPRRFVTLTNSAYALGIAKYLINDMGLLPETQFIIDGTPEEHQENIRQEFQKIIDGYEVPVVFTEDGGWAQQEIRKIPFVGKPLIFGSAWERTFTEELDGYHLSVSAPVSDRMVLDRAYFGYRGALRLLEDIYTVILSDFQ
ncbi:nitrogenase component 1 [Heliophilum fasciatum]|uniref:Nitrogenase molybdenum-iron protein beta chain n=1 Tax=Heliophilum fasciatum TaxID=35700 RepID=A0A4R2RM50_9FIRM|nr:nitrogenase component 1 [Heliophilum fasciatum]MCW2277693.1 nitrogenase molybdenum-iron protein beta chain [Heliophilum fasciatum]TCP65040.1 nitrogenase molybdenum-iron protein beta chain [Heliophilum fasciatum]